VSSELERFPLLASLSEDERRDLAQELEWLSFEAGASIFIEGDAADGLLLLLDGRVRLTSSRAEGAGECGPGASFGSLSLVLDAGRRASVEARTPCRVLRLRREGFQRLAKSSPHVVCRILEGVVRESADLVGRVLEAPHG
jgi:CRP-like cAMP-binding protein